MGSFHLSLKPIHHTKSVNSWEINQITISSFACQVHWRWKVTDWKYLQRNMIPVSMHCGFARRQKIAKEMQQMCKRQIRAKKPQSIDQHSWLDINHGNVCKAFQQCGKFIQNAHLIQIILPSVTLCPFLLRMCKALFLLPGCLLARGWRSAARWCFLACSQYYVANICHLWHLQQTKPHRTGSTRCQMALVPNIKSPLFLIQLWPLITLNISKLGKF